MLDGFVPVTRASELSPGAMKWVAIDRERVLIANVDGSFYDFVAERYRGTARERLASPPDAWGGRAAANWVTRLRAGERFSSEAAQLIEVARIIDRIYGR